MSMFGDGTKREDIYQWLGYVYRDRYESSGDSPQCEFDFVMDVLYVLQAWFGD